MFLGSGTFHPEPDGNEQGLHKHIEPIPEDIDLGGFLMCPFDGHGADGDAFQTRPAEQFDIVGPPHFFHLAEQVLGNGSGVQLETALRIQLRKRCQQAGKSIEDQARCPPTGVALYFR